MRIGRAIMALLLTATLGCGPGASMPPPGSPVALTRPAPAQSAGKATAATAPERLGVLPPDVGIPVGSAAPDAALTDARGNPVRLSDVYGHGPVLLVFYRGGWCPYCNYEIHALTEAWPEFERRGVDVVAISVDRPEAAAATQATYTIPFRVLSDPDLAAVTAWRVLHTADAAEVERLRGFGIDLEGSSGRGHHGFAIPSLFLVDRTGMVRWAHADPDYNTRPSTAQILGTLDALSGSAASP